MNLFKGCSVLLIGWINELELDVIKDYDFDNVLILEYGVLREFLICVDLVQVFCRFFDIIFLTLLYNIEKTNTL